MPTRTKSVEINKILNNSEIRLYHCHCESSCFETARNSHRRCSVKKIALENFAKLTGKHLCPCPTQVFSRQCYQFFENTFFTEHFRATAFDE